MKELVFQKINDTAIPFSQEDKAIWDEFKTNQLIKAKIYGVSKERSYRQLKLFFGCCRTVMANTEDPHWDSEDKVAFQVKVSLQFVDMEKTIVDAKGNIHLYYRSISYAELPHMAACNFFDRAFKVLAKKIGITVDELLKNTEEG